MPYYATLNSVRIYPTRPDSLSSGAVLGQMSPVSLILFFTWATQINQKVALRATLKVYAGKCYCLLSFTSLPHCLLSQSREEWALFACLWLSLLSTHRSPAHLVWMTSYTSVMIFISEMRCSPWKSASCKLSNLISTFPSPIISYADMLG